MSELYIGIDPGDTQSAITALLDGELLDFGIYQNGEDFESMFLRIYEDFPAEKRIGIEMIASYGMPVGKSVFETCLYIGELSKLIKTEFRDIPRKVYRKEVKMHLCGSMRAKDGNIRQALIDLFPASGNGKIPQIGTKAIPGPLYGVSKDVWAALGVAVTASAKWESLENY